MKKFLILSITFYGAFLQLNAQTLVYNDKLLVQLTKNQAMRLASNES